MRKTAKIEVRCTPEELAGWKRKCVGTLSEWIRSMCNDPKGVPQLVDVTTNEAIEQAFKDPKFIKVWREYRGLPPKP